MKSDQNTQPFIPPLLGLFFGILAVSSASVLIRFAQQGAPSLAVATYRLTLATILLAPLALSRHKDEIRKLSLRKWLALALSGLFLAFHFATWITSLEYTSIASSVVLVTTAPLWVSVFSPLILREKLPPAILGGLAVALTGGMIVGISQACTVSSAGLTCPPFATFIGGRAFGGNLLALAGAFLSGAYLMVGRKVRAEMSLVPYVFLVYGFASIFLLVMSGVTATPLFGFSPQTYLWFVLLALVPQLLGHTSFNWALRYLSAAYVSIALLGEPVGTVILAFLLLKESPTVLELAGGVLILTGIYLASLAESRRAAQINIGG
jgi:drug/metabolite transporter (DMT)-like permease